MRRGWVWPMIWRRLGLDKLGSKLGSDPNLSALIFLFEKSGSDPNFFQLPLPSAKAILGNCVVLPDPVSPQTMTTWCACMADMMSSRRALTGRSSGNSIV